MGFLKQIFGSTFERNIKKKYTLGSYSIVLLNDSLTSENDRTSNIAAYDSDGVLKWIAETPDLDFKYYDMQVDEDKSTVIGESGGGKIYTISLEDGRILHSELRK